MIVPQTLLMSSPVARNDNESFRLPVYIACRLMSPSSTPMTQLSSMRAGHRAPSTRGGVFEIKGLVPKSKPDVHCTGLIGFERSKKRNLIWNM